MIEKYIKFGIDNGLLLDLLGHGYKRIISLWYNYSSLIINKKNYVTRYKY